MNGEDRAAIVALEVEVKSLRADVREMRTELKLVTDWMNQRKGALGYAAIALTALIALTAAAGGAIVSVLIK